MVLPGNLQIDEQIHQPYALNFYTSTDFTSEGEPQLVHHAERKREGCVLYDDTVSSCVHIAHRLATE